MGPSTLLFLALSAQHGGAFGELPDLVSPFGYDAPHFIANVGDRDGDRTDDMMACFGASLRILAGDDLRTLQYDDFQTLYGETNPPQHVVRLGDLNGDGIEELAISFRFEDHRHSYPLGACERGRWPDPILRTLGKERFARVLIRENPDLLNKLRSPLNNREPLRLGA
jgi:hypothetical protein